MPRHASYLPHGVIPAVLLPFNDDFSIDEKSFRAHLRDVAAVKGISAITINAHSTEVASCTFDEQRRVLEIAQDEIGDARAAGQRRLGGRQPGGGAHRPHGAARRRFGAAGFPAGAVHARPIAGDGARAFQAHRRRDRSADHRVPVSAGDRPGLSARHAAAHLPTRCRPCAPSRTGAATCRSTRCTCACCRAGTRPVNVLSTHSAWLLCSLVLGCNGLLSGSGSVIADLQAALFRAVQANDLAEARRINDRIYPLARVFYREPWADMHNRMKEALVLLGRLPRAVVRPPLVKLASAEIEDIRRALIEAGLLGSERGRNAA